MFGSGLGAGRGADMLQDILQQKFREAIAMREIANREAEVRARQQIAQQQLGLDTRRLDQDDAALQFRKGRAVVEDQQYADGAEDRAATTRFKTAQSADLEGRPAREHAAAAARVTEAEADRAFTAKENALNRGNALRIANVRHPDPSSAAAQEKEADEIQESLDLITQIRNDPARETSTGPFQGRGLGMLSGIEGYTRFQSLHDNLVSKMQLAQAGKLKGQGQISNEERKMLANAATALKMRLGDQDYLNELAKVEQFFQRRLPGPRVQKANAPQADAAAKPDYRKKYGY